MPHKTQPSFDFASRLKNYLKYMDGFKLILGTLLWPGLADEKHLLLNKNIYIIINFFSLTKPLEHFKIFTFYIKEKKI